jgi:hypothetical protein
LASALPDPASTRELSLHLSLRGPSHPHITKKKLLRSNFLSLHTL